MHTDAMGREKTFNIRFSEDEWSWLDSLTKHYALPASGVIRMLLKREADAVVPPAKAEKAKRGSK